jgi:hypothetical protein
MGSLPFYVYSNSVRPYVHLMRSKLAIGIGSVLLIVLPAAGTIGGAFLGHDYASPKEPVCGLFVFPYMLLVGVGATLGLAIGATVGYVAALGLIRWSNRGWVDDDLDGDLRNNWSED